jgi:hypothetical protein
LESGYSIYFYSSHLNIEQTEKISYSLTKKIKGLVSACQIQSRKQRAKTVIQRAESQKCSNYGYHISVQALALDILFYFWLLGSTKKQNVILRARNEVGYWLWSIIEIQEPYLENFRHSALCVTLLAFFVYGSGSASHLVSPWTKLYRCEKKYIYKVS